GVNFGSFTQTVSFSAGQASNTISVTVIDDDQARPDTSFSIQLSDPANATLGSRSNMTITILDNDAPGHPASGANGSVNVVRTAADGGIVLGGGFLSVNGKARMRLARLLPNT